MSTYRINLCSILKRGNKKQIEQKWKRIKKLKIAEKEFFEKRGNKNKKKVLILQLKEYDFRVQIIILLYTKNVHLLQNVSFQFKI